MENGALLMKTGEIISEPTFPFESSETSPEFLGKYYKTYKDNHEIYYTNEIVESGEGL